MKKQLILHIPHSSTVIPLNSGYLISDQALEQEMLKLTDWYTDDLFFSEDDRIIKAGFSRIFCDPERFTDDAQEIMSQFGMGVLYVMTDEGEPIREIDALLREKILNTYYWTHHKLFSEAVNEQLTQFGKALIIDCHSYPSTPLKRDLNKEAIRPDFNIGTDPFHTPKELIDISVEFFKDRGFSLGIDWPYKGSIVPLEYYGKNKNVQSIMLEINRKLYLKEPTNEKSERYAEIKSVTGDFIRAIKKSLS